jgi:ATP-dependent Clp protease adaptor protein ClpS
MSATDIVLEEKTKLKVKEPTLWKVIFLNDDATPMDFVISLLVEVFKHNPKSAYDVTMQVHEQGSGIAGVYSHEIAEAKSVEATTLSRANGFPLQIKMEEE